METTIRKLASVQQVVSVSAIEGADSIELIQILGWVLIAKKGEFVEGDLAVFFEIDSILPETEWSEFLRPKKFHIKTMKLGKFGVISQGLALPLSVLDEHKSEYYDWREGDDVTEVLGVTKYEAPETSVNFGVGVIDKFHPFIPKTDEPRIQSNPAMLNELYGQPFYITQKLDGTSCTVVCDDAGVHVYSRNLEVDETSMYYQVCQAEGLIEVVKTNPFIAIQGEIVGEGIQKNRLGLKGKHFYAFNVLDLKNIRYVGFNEFQRFCFTREIKTVPLLLEGECFDWTLEELELFADGGCYGNSFPQEGIVVRPQREQRSQSGMMRLSFKVINKNFLLKIGE